MTEKAVETLTYAASQRAFLRWVIPGAAVLSYAGLAALWHWGPRSAYFGILRFFGFVPFRFPFLDIQAVLAAAQCHRLGIDVYLWNPCDALGRPHVYSPLWLRIVPGFLGNNTTMAIGLGLGLLFIAALALVCRPATAREALLMGLVALSPMAIYALERANNDLFVFLLIVAGCALARASRPWRYCAYALYLVAGLLKYYPLVLLVLIARERRRDAVMLSTAAVLILVPLALAYRSELARALANIPSMSYFADSFAAVNLPLGLTEGFGEFGFRGLFAGCLALVLIVLLIARVRRTLHLANLDPVGLDRFERECLIVGALLLTTCFFAGQNVDYRGVYFILVVPGVLHLQRAARTAVTRRFLTGLIAVVLFVTWEPSLRHLLRLVLLTAPPGAVASHVQALFWLGRELVWWWLVAGLSAIVCAYLGRDPLVRDVLRAALRFRVPGAVHGADQGSLVIQARQGINRER